MHSQDKRVRILGMVLNVLVLVVVPVVLVAGLVWMIVSPGRSLGYPDPAFVAAMRPEKPTEWIPMIVVGLLVALLFLGSRD
jgi:hypothetical protein